MVPVLTFALLLGNWSRLGTHGREVPAMALLSLLTVGGTSSQFTYLTVVETVAGGAIGVLTNAIVIAPLHLHRPREQVAAFATQVHDLLVDMATGLREDWDEQQARQWYRTGGLIADSAPHIVNEIQTGQESTQLNPRQKIRPLDIDWEGYGATVSVLRQALWQVTGIARTLVDAADEQERQPAPSPSFLARYAAALTAIADAVTQLGLRTPEAAAAFDQHTATAQAILTELAELVRQTPLDNHHVWPVYGSMITDAQRAISDLQAGRARAVLPTDSGPLPLVPSTAQPRPVARLVARARRRHRRRPRP
jgi:hypothetical protein